MVRTKADGCSASRKAVAASAPRKALASTSSSSSGDSPAGKGGKYAGGNAYCPRPTPDWQKGIGMFLSPSKTKGKENAGPVEEGECSIMEEQSAGSSQGSSSSGSSSSSNSD